MEKLEDSDAAFLFPKYHKASFAKAAGNLEPKHAEQASKAPRKSPELPTYDPPDTADLVVKPRRYNRSYWVRVPEKGVNSHSSQSLSTLSLIRQNAEVTPPEVE